MKRGFIINEDMMNAVRDLDGEQFKEFFTKSFDYAMKGEEPTFSHSFLNAVFKFYRSYFDWCNKRFDEKAKSKGEQTEQQKSTKRRVGNMVAQISAK